MGACVADLPNWIGLREDSGVSELTVGRIALALKPHRDEIVEADEWRPLAKHVLYLTRLSDAAIRADEVRRIPCHYVEISGAEESCDKSSWSHLRWCAGCKHRCARLRELEKGGDGG